MARGRHRLRLRTLATILLLACATAYLIALGQELWHQAHEWTTRHSGLDFPSYYLAAHRLLQGQDPYSGLRAEARLRLGIQDYFIDVAVGPPAFIAAIFWLAFLPYLAAWATWQFLSLAALVGALWLGIRRLKPAFSREEWLALAGATILFPPLAFHMVYAHTELFMLLLLTAAWLSLRRDRQLLAGLLLGLAGATRLYPLLFLLFLVQRRAWKALAAAATSALGLSVLGGLLCGLDAYPRYWAILHETTPDLYAREGNASLWGTVYKLAVVWPSLSSVPGLREALAFLLSAGTVALVFWLVARKAAGNDRASFEPALDQGFALYVVACLLASPLAWVNYQVLLYLPFLVLLARVRERPCRPCLWALGVAAIASLSPLAALFWSEPPISVARVLAFLPTLTPAATFAALALLPPPAASGTGSPSERSLAASAA